MNFPAAGSFQISLDAAQRNYRTSNEEVQVEVDGTVVGTITPGSTSYADYSTRSFNVTAGSHTISFVGVAPAGADYTALLDQVSINSAPPTGFADPGFESPSEGAGSLAFQYDVTGSAWTFSGGAGVAGNGSGFTSGNPNAPQGSQVAFLQGGTSQVSQAVNFASAGSYLISFSAAQRGTSAPATRSPGAGGRHGGGHHHPSQHQLRHLLDGPFNVTAGSHTITFAGVDPSGTDYTALIDQVSINSVSPTGFTDPSFENPVQGSGKSTYRPTGSAWTFSGGAGLAGNGSGFTGGNPNAPQGSQVAFLQRRPARSARR